MNQIACQAARPKGRLDSVDQFRGFAILLMALVDYFSRIRTIPNWLKHAQGGGMTVADTVAPMFIFAIGLMYGLSMRRRLARDGAQQTYLHFLRRSLALIGFGIFFTFEGSCWGLFQTLGMAVLLTLPIVRLPTVLRLIIGVIVLGAYQVSLDLGCLGEGWSGVWDGIQWSIGWTAMLILSTVLADLSHGSHSSRRVYIWSVLLVLVIGIALSRLVVVSLHQVSASYVLIGLGISGITFAAFHALTNRLNIRLPLLIAWGKNPLLLYFLHYWLWIFAFLGLPTPFPDWWHRSASLWLVGVQSLAFIGVLSAAAWFLDRRGWIVSL